MNTIQRAVNDKHEAFLNLYNAQIVASESMVLKEHYEKELASVEQVLKTSGADFESIKEIMVGHQEKKMSQFNVRFLFCV